MTKKKPPAKANGDACPYCGGHAFELLQTPGGMFVIKCLCCKQKLEGRWSCDVAEWGGG